MTSVPPEAFEYDDDVTPEAIEQLRVEADEILSKQEWTVVCMSKPEWTVVYSEWPAEP